MSFKHVSVTLIVSFTVFLTEPEGITGLVYSHDALLLSWIVAAEQSVSALEEINLS